MSYRPTTVERAYQLANSGECANVGEIKVRLKAEGYSDMAGQLYGSSITGDLRRRCIAARAAAEQAPKAAPEAVTAKED